MKMRTLLALLLPAITVATFVYFFNPANWLPPALAAFTLALLASLFSLIIHAWKPARSSGKPAREPAPKTTTAGGKRETGSVKWFNPSKGFGFITRTNGDEIFVHHRSVNGQRALKEGQKVEFIVTTGSKGLQAEEVVALK
jgi:cold shock protein